MMSGGSRIITTSRVKDVAQSCCSSFSGCVYNIRPLDMMYSRQLFHRRLFKPEEDFPSHLKDVSDEILKKCGGLPLAIIAISGLLANRENTKDKWDQVKISIGCALERNPSVEGMMKILSLSYFDLPPHLKTCLLYFSIYPEDGIIPKEDLIWKWIAEGFICKEGKYTLYENGEKCFNELLNRSLIQPRGADFGVVKYCQVHDTILDFIKSKSIEENFVTFVRASNTTIGTQCKVRRLSIQVDKQGNSFVPKDLALWQVRSLCMFGIFGNPEEIPSLDRFRHLRVLDFGGCAWLKTQHVEDIGRLLQLRYLSLRSTTVSELPQRIGDLCCLERLDLRNTKLIELPTSIVNLKKLVHLLVDLQVEIPNGIAKMQALETCIFVYVSLQSKKSMQELGQLKNLKKLQLDFRRVSARGDENGVTEEDVKATVSSLQNLRTLHMRNGGNFFMKADLFPVALRKLRVDGSNFTRVLNSVGSLVNLRDLFLWLDRVSEENLCILGGLPALIKLELELLEFEDSRESRVIVSAAHGFSCLRLFIYDTEDNEMDLMFTAGSMPKLEELDTIFDAVKTEAITGGDFDYGVENLTCLTTIICRYAYNESVDAINAAKVAIEEKVRTHPNQPRLHFQ
jgi:disease resistance protein RPM1